MTTTAPPLQLYLEFLPPGQVTFPRLVGSAVEGGMSLSGITDASDATGGGLWQLDYSNIVCGNVDQSRLRLINRIGVALAGGIRTIVVPFPTDFIQPVDIRTLPNGVASFAPPGTTFDDGSTFSDGSGYYQPSVAGLVVGAQPVGAGTISLSVIGGTGILEGGEFFGLTHPVKGARAYCVTDIDAQSADSNGNAVYTVGIRPPLRDSIANNAQVDWWRPKCLMRLLPGSSIDLDVKPFWLASPNARFIESF